MPVHAFAPSPRKFVDIVNRWLAHVVWLAWPTGVPVGRPRGGFRGDDEGDSMSCNTRSAGRVGLVVAMVLALLGLTAQAASAADENVKYYTVTTSYAGKPENLTEIADRFLGSGSRSSEIFNLNTGRKQPDGQALTDPAKVNPGWLLILPWDAVGAGVQHGVLGDKSPTTVPSPMPRSSSPSPGTTKPDKGTTSPGSAAKPGQSPKPGTKPKPGQCATASTSSSKSNWATLRLAPDQAWPTSRGNGQLVAVVDSGVDGSLPQLAGHVSEGMDIIAGSGRGDTDCLGTGTGMAGLVVSQDRGSSGIAPEATVMPVRITDAAGKARAEDSASAITAAAEAGATVIALGSHVDTNDSGVLAAINGVVGKDVIVVACSSLASVAAAQTARTAPGLLRVGGIGMDGQWAADYRLGGIDVVAPGVNITELGITGTGSSARSGTQYAVAFVAGAAALVRAAYPDLTAQQVAHRIEATAQKMGSGKVPDARYGYGLIDLAASVTTRLPEEVTKANVGGTRTSGDGMTDGRTTLLVVVILLALAAAVMLVLRVRRLLRNDRSPDEDSFTEPSPVRG
ncbi:S8 family serine peptidase [Micromonospora lupini]|uniref:S8 family serine peptidase n=1 Tax=Micromonospora lupini TaxID=285679 RepID=UPI00340DCE29